MNPSIFPDRVLIADGDPGIRALILRLLEGWDSLLIETADGEEGIQIAQWKCPELAILGDDLGCKGAPAIAEEIRRMRLGRRCVIVILSTEEAPTQSEGAPRYDWWVRKPFSVLEFRDSALALFRRRMDAPANPEGPAGRQSKD